MRVKVTVLDLTLAKMPVVVDWAKKVERILSEEVCDDNRWQVPDKYNSWRPLSG